MPPARIGAAGKGHRAPPSAAGVPLPVRHRRARGTWAISGRWVARDLPCPLLPWWEPAAGAELGGPRHHAEVSGGSEGEVGTAGVGRGRSGGTEVVAVAGDPQPG